MPIILAVALPFLIWIVLRFVLPAGPFEFDAGGKEGRFYALLILYSTLFYVVAGLSIFGATFAWSHQLGWSAALFLLAATYALLFNGVTVLFYEGYLAFKATFKASSRSGSNYTLTKYAIVQSLGWSAMILLFVAGVVMAMELAR